MGAVMSSQEAYLTPEGLDSVRFELEHFRTVRRRKVADGLRSAAEVGGTVDNAEYDEAKREQDSVERRIASLEKLLHIALIIPERTSPSEIVEVGSRVTVSQARGKPSEYLIVGSTEADPIQGKISNESPIGRAILGKRVGEKVEVRTPSGLVGLTILKIE